MTTNQPTFLTHDDLARELAVARRDVEYALEEIRSFGVIRQEHPWVHLDGLLAELRAAATTVAVLEGVMDRQR